MSEYVKKELHDLLKKLVSDVNELKHDVAELRHDNAELRHEQAEFRSEVAEFRHDNVELRLAFSVHERETSFGAQNEACDLDLAEHGAEHTTRPSLNGTHVTN